MKRNMNSILDDFFKEENLKTSEDKCVQAPDLSDFDSDKLMEMLKKQSEELSKMNTSSLDLLSENEKKEIMKQVQNDFGSMNIKNSPQKSVGVVVEKHDVSKIDVLYSLLSKEIIDQDAFVKALCIGLKRPLIMGHQKEDVLNAILLCGKRGSGKHSSLLKAVQYLKSEAMLPSDKVSVIDLALYNDKEDETLFIQDIYMATQATNGVVLFDNLEKITKYYLQLLQDIIVHSKIQLTKRYGINKNQLVEANNTLLANAISSISFSGKYIVLLSDDPLNKLTDKIGTSFIKNISDICETQAFSKEGLNLITQALLDNIVERCKDNLDFECNINEEVLDYIVSNYKKDMGVYSLIDYLDQIYYCLSQYKLENFVGKISVDLYIMNEEIYTRFNEDVLPLMGLKKDFFSSNVSEIKAELAKIVGLDEVKDYLLSLEDDFKIQAMRKKQGLKTATVSKHMIFTGNPGTGKTTIARILARYLKAINVLSGGQLVEVTRADLVGRYVGHTAPLTNQVIKSALGGVLFIDEAYALYRGKDDSFGLEAIDALVKGMEDNRDNLLVVLAGYSKEMQEFLKANSGLKSRFPNYIDFKDYSGEELLEIANIQAESKDYYIQDEAKEPLLDYFKQAQALNAQSNGNGRLARNKVEEAILNQSRRLIVEKCENMKEISLKDFDLTLKN